MQKSKGIFDKSFDKRFWERNTWCGSARSDMINMENCCYLYSIVVAAGGIVGYIKKGIILDLFIVQAQLSLTNREMFLCKCNGVADLLKP